MGFWLSGFSGGGPTRGRLVTVMGSGGGPTLFPELSEERRKVCNSWLKQQSCLIVPSGFIACCRVLRLPWWVESNPCGPSPALHTLHKHIDTNQTQETPLQPLPVYAVNS